MRYGTRQRKRDKALMKKSKSDREKIKKDLQTKNWKELLKDL
jgi:hypothetical protein